jgi:predicted nucleic acid-binding protein
MSAESAVYMDSSALVKLIVREPESAALRHYLRRRPQRVSCGLARVEVVRAVRSQGEAAHTRARALLERLSLLRLDDSLLDAAAQLDGPSLRSLDAIHLAAAQALGAELEGVVTYDVRMQAAANGLGLSVASPS